MLKDLHDYLKDKFAGEIEELARRYGSYATVGLREFDETAGQSSEASRLTPVFVLELGLKIVRY